MAAAEFKVLYALQMLAGGLSCIGSTTIAAMVVKSEPKLKTPSRRLIFGLSISDIFQSLASVIGPLATVPISDVDEQHSSKLWNSSGNQRACDFQGFLVLFGGTMCAFYTLALCIYYLCAVKYNMSDEKFGRTTEWKLHVIAFVYSFGTSFFYIVAGLYNNFPDGNMCFVIESPPGCHKNPDIECHRGKHASNFNLSLTFVPLMVIGGGIQYSLGSLYLFVKKDKDRQQKRFTVSMKMNPVSPGQRRGSVVKFSGLNGAGTPIMDNSKIPQNAEDLRDEEAIINTIARMRDNKASRQSNLGRYSARIRRSIFGEDSKFGSIQQSFFRKRSTDISEMYVTRAQRRATEVKRQTLEKALLYVGAYMAVYTLPLLTYFVWYRDGKDQPIPVTIIMHTLFPLQGLLNIYVYTKTKVQAIRKQCQDFSWHKAMWEVIKGGGDIPVHHMRTRRRSRGAGMLGTEVPIELNLRRSKRSGRSRCS